MWAILSLRNGLHLWFLHLLALKILGIGQKEQWPPFPSCTHTLGIPGTAITSMYHHQWLQFWQYESVVKTNCQISKTAFLSILITIQQLFLSSSYLHIIVLNYKKHQILHIIDKVFHFLHLFSFGNILVTVQLVDNYRYPRSASCSPLAYGQKFYLVANSFPHLCEMHLNTVMDISTYFTDLEGLLESSE